MRKYLFVLMFLAVCGNALAQLEREPVEKTAEYWVYVRLEDRSGVTPLDDAGRSKAGDVVAVLPVNAQNIPSETEKKEWMIYKTSLTETQRQEMIEPLEEVVVREDGSRDVIPIAYRKNKLDTSKLGIAVKKGLAAEKIDSTNIETSVKTVDDLAKYEMKRKFYAYVQRPVIRLTNIVIPYAFAAENVSTCNTTGENYNTIALWEDAKDYDLVTATTTEILEVYKDQGMITAHTVLSGATTSADYYRKITVPTASRHTGVAGTGTKVHSTDGYTATLRVFQENYFVIEWLEITRTTTTPDGDGNCCILLGGQYNTARYNIVHDGIATTSGTIAGIKGKDQPSGVDTWVYGNIIYRNSGNGINFGNSFAMDNYAYNNTVYLNGGIGINGGGDKANNVYINNISMSNVGGDYGNAKTNTNNLSTGAAVTFVSVVDNSEDFHITSVSTDAIDAGTDLSSVFTLDIDSAVRSGTWDIGADEYASGAPPQIF